MIPTTKFATNKMKYRTHQNTQKRKWP